MNPSDEKIPHSTWPRLNFYLGLLLSGLSGLLCFSSFPPSCCGWSIIFALVPLLLAVFSVGTAVHLSFGKLLSRGAALGAIFGLVLYSLVGFWSSEVSQIAWILWTLLTAVFYAVWGTLAVTIVRRWSTPTKPHRSALRSILCHLELAAAWWACEWLRSLITPGSDIGTCLAYSGKIIQIADVIGQLGVSAWVVYLSCQIVLILRSIGARPARQGLLFSTLTTVAIALTVYGYGHWRHLKIRQAPYKITLKCITVQPHLPSPTGASEIINWMLALKKHTEEALTICPDPDLIVWPESALRIALGSPFAQNVLPKNLPLSCLFYSGFSEISNGLMYNSLGVFDAKFNLLASHRKTQLMPFTEYAPWGITSLADFVLPKHQQNYFASGNGHRTLRSSSAAGYTVIPLICYEDCGSTPARLSRDHGSPQIIIDIANDAAFRRDQGAVQHFTNASFRAIELGCPLVRCANSGYSAVVNQGDFPELKYLESKRSFLIDTLQLKQLPPTPFSLWGHYLPHLAFILTGIRFGSHLTTGRKTAVSNP
jgi:apolipoprotein N-acyltransferase